MIIFWIIIFSILGSIGAIIFAFIFLLFEKKKQQKFITCLVSYASGTLLAGALLGLIPHALINKGPLPFLTTIYEPHSIMATVLIGIILFFILEKLLTWHHCHDMDCEVHGTAGSMILIGDAFHNLTDGLVIAAAFLVSIPLGIASSLSIIAHEIPQEVGDFGILIHEGYSKKKALLLNLLSSITTIPGAIFAFYALDIIHATIPYIMAISASSFLYVSLADLIPELHNEIESRSALFHFILMLTGIMTIIFALQFHM